MAGHRFDPTVLREYDIRGVIGETLGTADALAVAICHAHHRETAVRVAMAGAVP